MAVLYSSNHLIIAILVIPDLVIPESTRIQPCGKLNLAEKTFNASCHKSLVDLLRRSILYLTVSCLFMILLDRFSKSHHSPIPPIQSLKSNPLSIAIVILFFLAHFDSFLMIIDDY